MKMKVLFLFLFHVVPIVLGLQEEFYKTTCPKAETIIKEVVGENMGKHKSTMPAGLIRIFFHDCFVRGCDASVMIGRSTNNHRKPERKVDINLSLRGFKILDEAKKRLEKECPGIVSCADIIAVAARDAVALAGGPTYNIPTGRRDGLTSNAPEVDLNIPAPNASVADAEKIFKGKGFTLEEMVVLMGAHSIGYAHCRYFKDRLDNFQGTGAADPSLDPALLEILKGICSKMDPKQSVNKEPLTFLDQNTSYILDNEYYNQILKKRGVLQFDHALATDPSTAGMVEELGKDPAKFNEKLAAVMVKLGNVEVLEGDKGEIRKKCDFYINDRTD